VEKTTLALNLIHEHQMPTMYLAPITYFNYILMSPSVFLRL